MPFGIDIQEDELLDWGHEILETLLADRTTGENIIWATDDYSSRGEGYLSSDSIQVELITGENNHVIQPRIQKPLAEQEQRKNDKAEVFTPAWICNAQNNLIDKAWFQTEQDVFNHEINDEQGHRWEMIDAIPNYPHDKDWRKYIIDKRLEMACGEAPYLCSRYDATTGEMIEINRRIGLLDRKLKLVNLNTPDIKPEHNAKQRKNIHRTWRRAAYKALQSIYAFEMQGDSLLLARESVLITFVEYYQAKWNTDKLPNKQCLKKAAEIISWNIWQMDGLKQGIPGYTPTEDLERNLFNEVPPREKFCRIMEWSGQDSLTGKEVIFKTMLHERPKKK